MGYLHVGPRKSESGAIYSFGIREPTVDQGLTPTVGSRNFDITIRSQLQPFSKLLLAATVGP